MKHLLVTSLLLSLAGCAGGPATRAPSATAARTATSSEAERTQAARIRELEAQLGLAQATNQALETELAEQQQLAASRVTRIRACAPADSPDVTAAAPAPDNSYEDGAAPAAAGGRPVLRLHGAPPRPAMNSSVAALPGPLAPSSMPAAPLGAARLPVVGVPGDPEAGVPAIPMAPVAVGEAPPVVGAAAPTAPPTRPAEDAGARMYREALRHLAERRPADALRGLSAFLRAHPDHSYADNALYWRGEIHYTQRDYRGALTAFGSLLERYPNGNKVPDALLRIGLCYQRLGDDARARRVLTRLRAQYPDTVAARLAAREDA